MGRGSYLLEAHFPACERTHSSKHVHYRFSQPCYKVGIIIPIFFPFHLTASHGHKLRARCYPLMISKAQSILFWKDCSILQMRKTEVTFG